MQGLNYSPPLAELESRCPYRFPETNPAWTSDRCQHLEIEDISDEGECRWTKDEKHLPKFGLEITKHMSRKMGLDI
jgi:hypothetical protein